ncbi:MAG: hypothetical protein A2Y62_17290 [Candidatus Fischerbacteria bacterium RBG_13_37_8]|uniref:non-specific serine/threonine protein kinase n=1 Tax=Candidatus Fischerbacteria bacterium RBG_13_37_8 TaxID=1817863 RepID=A0A1F5VG34_9BACT|nr:MAG: hypothetical protein A2Y62_17290 [Candidatus Fischerbacteria bacterium RBG_13_37_8]
MQINKYKIVKSLKKTSKWELFLARHVEDKFHVKIRIFNHTLTSSEQSRNKLIKALEYFYLMRNKYLISILEYGFLDKNVVYEIIEHLDYLNLREIINKAHRIPQEIAAIIMQELLNGLHQAHSRGIYHGYLNPHLVVTSTTGIVKIQDFAYAENDPSYHHFLCADSLHGNMYYAPEHILQKPLDKRTDFFLLGILSYEMLTGKHPFWVADKPWDMHKILSDNQEPLFATLPHINPVLERIIEKLLHKIPDERYEDSEIILQEMEPYIKLLGDMRSYEILSAYFIDPKVSTEQIEHNYFLELYEQARTHFYSKHYTKALFMFEILNRQADKFEGVDVYINDIKEKKGYLPQNENVLKLIEELKNKLAHEPGNISLMLKLSNLYREIGNYIDSVYYSKKILQVEKTNEQALENISDFIKIESRDYETPSHFSSALAQSAQSEDEEIYEEFPLHRKLLVAVLLLAVIILGMSRYGWIDFSSLVAEVSASSYTENADVLANSDIIKLEGLLLQTRAEEKMKPIIRKLFQLSEMNLSKEKKCEVTGLLVKAYARIDNTDKSFIYFNKLKRMCKDFAMLKTVYMEYGRALEKNEKYPEALDVYLELLLNATQEDKNYKIIEHKVKELQKNILLTLSATPEKKI